jgi:hypothetical protein
MPLPIAAALSWVLAIAFGWICAFGRKTGRLASKGCMIEKEKAPLQFKMTLVAYDAVTVGSLCLAVWFSWCLLTQ